ncbi:hypothetical protein P0082_05975 [Candidatus Haliotispira prima]|uniref:Uncharacterized protein n=1 Tax=Candidatus Haliotispira prima TaxID=3034016 RepID=A0ABY8MK45_9SPIO|nr:hypothetical protein P0082_05975 [Candidatus Haliotispira prima]
MSLGNPEEGCRGFHRQAAGAARTAEEYREHQKQEDGQQEQQVPSTAQNVF